MTSNVSVFLLCNICPENTRLRELFDLLMEINMKGFVKYKSFLYVKKKHSLLEGNRAATKRHPCDHMQVVAISELV